MRAPDARMIIYILFFLLVFSMGNPPLPSLLAQPALPPRTLDKNHARFGFVSRNKFPSLVLMYERHPEWFVPHLFLRNNSPLADARNAASSRIAPYRRYESSIKASSRHESPETAIPVVYHPHRGHRPRQGMEGGRVQRS